MEQVCRNFLFKDSLFGGKEKREFPAAQGKEVISESGSVAEEPEEETETEEKTADYIIPDSDSKMLTDADVAGLSLKEINYAKNEIYARHGRKFDSKELRDYFNSKDWYDGKISPADFLERVFNRYEKKNSEFLARKEESMQRGGYRLDE